MTVSYKPKTSQLERAECLHEIRKTAYGPGLELLRKILMDLDSAEAEIERLRRVCIDGDDHKPDHDEINTTDSER